MIGRWLFILYILTVVDVTLTIRCPTRQNESINITRIVVNNSQSFINDSIYVTWFKNNDSNIIAIAIYNPTTRGCSNHNPNPNPIPSINSNYTIYCEEYDNNNKYKFTLQVHQPVEGDVYYSSNDNNDTATIIFQEPENIDIKIEPRLKDEIILTDNTTIELNSTVTCTKPTPVFTWIINTPDGDDTTLTRSTTTDTTGCDANRTTLSSRVRISKDTVKIINDPFTVSVQLSYKECDNIYTSQPTPYFTTKDSDSVTLPMGTYTGIGVGGAVVLLIMIITVICCWKRKQKNKDEEHKYIGAEPSNSRNGVDSASRRDEIIIEENIEYVSQGGIFSDSVQYAVVNKKTQDERKGNEIIVDENVEYVELGDPVSPAVVPTRGYKESKKTKKGEELKYAEVDFTNQKPSTKIRGHGTKQSTVNYADINHKKF